MKYLVQMQPTGKEVIMDSSLFTPHAANSAHEAALRRLRGKSKRVSFIGDVTAYVGDEKSIMLDGCPTTLEIINLHFRLVGGEVVELREMRQE